MHDTVIRGGTIVDGTGKSAYAGDVAMDGDIIAQIYKERVLKRGYGSGAWGWMTAYHEDIEG